VYIGSGVGDLPESYAAHASMERATRAWNRFWSHRSRCAALRAFQDEARVPSGAAPPRDPNELEIDSEERFAARTAWDAYWAGQSDALARFETAYAEIERIPVGDDAERGPLHAIKARQRAHRKLMDEAGCPAPPWEVVDPKLIWAIQNVPAAQVSMLLGTHGPAWAPVGACSTFGVALKCGRDAILRGEAKVAIVGTTDPRPDPTLISAFHRARLVPATGDVNIPLTSLLGTHVAGGACVWVIADVEAMREQGLAPIGPSIDGVAISSDAEHIITPSASGPKNAIRSALEEAHADRNAIAMWDLHATGTPGDVSELKLARDFIGSDTAITARKGLFGHGMANAGGWEMTALAMCLADRVALPTGVPAESVHTALRSKYGNALVTATRSVSGDYGVKVMLGIGGVTACVVLGRSDRS
jgi:3-oxoacyl-(acyl-carrier-protein) synthase